MHSSTEEKKAPAHVDEHHPAVQHLYGERDAVSEDFSGAVLGASLVPGELLEQSFRFASKMTGAWETYADPRGFERLRAALAGRYFTEHASQDTTIRITSGCLSGIRELVDAIVPAGGSFAVFSPTYFGFLELARVTRRTVMGIPISTSGPDWDALEHTIADPDCAAIIYVPFGQNPTGFSWSTAARDRLLRRASMHDVAVIEDHIYTDLYFTTRGEQLAQDNRTLPEKGRVFIASSFSKTLSPALRLGWIAARDRTWRTINLPLFTAPTTVQQAALAHLLDEGAYVSHLNSLRPALARQLAETRSILMETQPTPCRVSNPEGGRVLWVELPEQIHAETLVSEAAKAGVGVLDGRICSLDPGQVNALRVDTGSVLTDARQNALETLGAIATRIWERGQ